MHKTLMLALLGAIAFSPTKGSASSENRIWLNGALSATIVEREGIDTSNAAISAEITAENAQEFCERDRGGLTVQYGGKLTVSECSLQTLHKEGGIKYAISADCLRGRVISTRGTFIFSKTGENREPIWRDLNTNKNLGSFSASGAYVVTDHYTKLCPSFAKRFNIN